MKQELEYFLVKVTLFVAHFLVYVSLNGAYLGMVSKILSPQHKLSVKVDNDQPRSQSTLSCFKKERFSLGARESEHSGSEVHNNSSTDDVTSGKKDVVTHARPLAVEGCAESSLNFFLLGSATLPVVDNTFDQSGQDNYKLLDKSNITAHPVLSIYHHREIFAIRS